MTSINSTGSSTFGPFGTAPGPQRIEGNPDELAVDALAMPHPPVVVELLAVVGVEGDTRAIGEAEVAETLHEASDLGVHAPDRAVVPVLRVAEVGVGVDAGLHELLVAGHAAVGPGIASVITFLRASCCRKCSLAASRIGPQGVVGLFGS